MRTQQLNPPRSPARVRRAFACLLFAAITGCSTFNRDWKAAAAAPALPNSIEGRWAGTWLSEENGHGGKLRCLITTDSGGGYHARFHAKYRKVLGFSYAVPLKVRKAGNVFSFQGEADLGWYAGGLYFYSGHVRGTNFSSTYRSEKDRGTFQMTRPPPEK